MSDTNCEFIDGCPMFKYFCRAAQDIYRELFCEGDTTQCERRTRRLAGQPVPENLLPHGYKLWPDGGPPPALWE